MSLASVCTDYPGLRRVHVDPPVYIVDDFVDASTCDLLIRAAEPRLRRSRTHSARGNRPAQGRTSLTCYLAKSDAPCVTLLRAIHALTRAPFGHMELPQVARYTQSQRYVAHHDGVDPRTRDGRAFCRNGGQRVVTVLVYLNDVAYGGGTRFPKLDDMTIQPRRGTALVFFPGRSDGSIDERVLHTALPAVDVKWVSQVWIRQRYRIDGAPSKPVGVDEQILDGTLHKGTYDGFAAAGDDLAEGDMTVDQAKTWAARTTGCAGFTYRRAVNLGQVVHVWFKRRLRVVDHSEWCTYSLGR